MRQFTCKLFSGPSGRPEFVACKTCHPGLDDSPMLPRRLQRMNLSMNLKSTKQHVDSMKRLQTLQTRRRRVGTHEQCLNLVLSISPETKTPSTGSTGGSATKINILPMLDRVIGQPRVLKVATLPPPPPAQLAALQPSSILTNPYSMEWLGLGSPLLCCYLSILL